MKEEKKIEEEKKEEPTLPQISSGIEGKHVIFTKKGWFTWYYPANSNFDDSIQYMKYLISQIELAIAKNAEKAKKKEKEEFVKVKEEEKVPIET